MIPCSHHHHNHRVAFIILTVVVVLAVTSPLLRMLPLIFANICNFIRILCEWTVCIVVFLYRIPSRVWNTLSGLWRSHIRLAPRTQISQSPLPFAPRVELPQFPPPIFLPFPSTPRTITPEPKFSSSLTPTTSHSLIPTPPPKSKPIRSECPICYEEMDDDRPATIGASCGHLLCQPCRELIVAHGTECHIRPTCHFCRLPYDSGDTLQRSSVAV